MKVGSPLLLAASLILSLMCREAFAVGYNVDVNADDGISFDLLEKKLISNPSVKTVEGALAFMPAEFMENYVLVYRSRSLQQSSFLYPRAIVFGKSGKFIVAFNGHPDQRGYDALEIIQFREDTNRFEFREIKFSADAAPAISEANPPRCIECHQSPKRMGIDLRPNWEPYNFWPGVYGSVDEKLEPVLKKNYERYLKKEQGLYAPLNVFEEQDMFLIDEQAQEQAFLKKFSEEIKPNHQRYRLLPEYSLRNAISLTKITIILNFRRIVRLMRESLGPMFDTYKYAIAGLARDSDFSSSGYLRRCGDLYLPEGAKALHLNALKKLRTVSDKEYLPKSPTLPHLTIPLAKGFELIFETLGVDTSDWSLEFKTGGRFSFDRDRFTSPHDSTVHLYDALKLVEPSAVGIACADLKQKSEEAIQKFADSGKLSASILEAQMHQMKPAPALINRCIKCHAASDDAMIPKIPFDDFAKLKPMLMQGKYKRGRLIDEIIYRTSDHAIDTEKMPPSGLASKPLREELIKALTALAR